MPRVPSSRISSSTLTRGQMPSAEAAPPSPGFLARLAHAASLAYLSSSSPAKDSEFRESVSCESEHLVVNSSLAFEHSVSHSHLLSQARLCVDKDSRQIVVSFAVTHPDALAQWMHSFDALAALADNRDDEGDLDKGPAPFYSQLHSYLAPRASHPQLSDFILLPPKRSPSQQDMDAVLVPFPAQALSSKVHPMFASEYAALRPSLVTALTLYRTQYLSYNLVFVGHSLGAAIATLALVDLVQSSIVAYPNSTHLVSFGMPRIGNAAFRESVLALQLGSIFRLVNYGDSVPHYGLQSWGFRHIERQLWINSSQNLVTCDDVNPINAGEDTNCMNQLVAAGPTFAHRKYLGFEMWPPSLSYD
ncbi:Alpha/Beta hydrolase protein [Chytriomyces sp. MP71]|nr:Alpha/Beta hydrolase protein [Chytriomyces sp. MP71]